MEKYPREKLTVKSPVASFTKEINSISYTPIRFQWAFS